MDTYSELVILDEKLHSMVRENPALADRYRKLMGEELGSVVLLPRMPTAEDWAAAEALARSRAR